MNEGEIAMSILERCDRRKLISVLGEVANVYNIGQNYVHSDSPYIVLKAKLQESSLNIKGAWQYYEVMCYTPSSSIVTLDDLIETVKEILKYKCPLAEITNELGIDYLDEEIDMYMRYLEIRVPKGA